jgi:hypothetical protein
MTGSYKVSVVALSMVGVTKHGIRLRDFDEPSSSFGIIWIVIRMVRL